MLIKLLNGVYTLRAPGIEITGSDKGQCFNTLMLAMINNVPVDPLNPTTIEIIDSDTVRIALCQDQPNLERLTYSMTFLAAELKSQVDTIAPRSGEMSSTSTCAPVSPCVEKDSVLPSPLISELEKTLLSRMLSDCSKK